MATAPSGSHSGRSSSGWLAGFILRRLLLGLLVLLLVSVVVFAATQALPGDPARSILGRTATPASLKALREQLRLDEPVLSAVHRTGSPASCTAMPGTRSPRRSRSRPTCATGSSTPPSWSSVAGSISIPISIAIGAYAALRRDRTFDVTTLARRRSSSRRCPSSSSAITPGRDLRDDHLPRASCRRHDHRARRAAVGQHGGDDPADAHARARRDAVRGPDHARLDDRGARVRLRRDGPAQGPPRADRDHPPRAAERARADVPGDRDQPRLPGRRRDRRRVRLQLRRDRRRAP